MPVNNRKANEVWNRYAWLRDNGHLKFVDKAERCENFFVGMQWNPNDIALLKAQKRPALTINKIISTLSNVLGEQIFNRTDIAFKPRNDGATGDIADALTKVFLQISDNNHLPWVRSDVFADGTITSRGFFDVRLDFSDSLRGEVRIEQINPKNVLIDCDADNYDPDTWNDVIVTKWLSADDVEMLYSKADADILRRSPGTLYTPYGYDSIDRDRDRFGFPQTRAPYGISPETTEHLTRNIRVLERQWRKLDNMKHFVDVTTGDMRAVPTDWDDAKIQAHIQANPSLSLTRKLVKRIRWTVVADNVVLHDDWSPYQHFTVVPYFPYFIRGKTVGLVENLLGPQELLNKVSSQELHVVNTTANSGWKVKRNALQNMTVPELENRGAVTGLVLELDEIANAEKIQPNQTPQGLDRISFKAEDHIKSISGVSDYMQGFAREDVSAKSVTANKQSGSANLAKVMDNMNRTDTILARNILDMVQEYYTEQRLIYITTDKLSNQTQQVAVNQPTPEGEIVNDLTLGEYCVVVTNQPERDTFEDTQFDQAVSLRKDIGVAIPDKVIIMASRLKDKAQIVQDMEAAQNSPEAQAQAQLKNRQNEAEVSKTEAEAVQKQSDAKLKQAKSAKEIHEIQNGGGNMIEAQQEQQKLEQEHAMEVAKAQQDYELEVAKMNKTFELKKMEMEQNLVLKREEHAQNMQIQKDTAKHNMMTDRIAAVEKAKQQPAAGAKPKPKPKKAGAK